MTNFVLGLIIGIGATLVVGVTALGPCEQEDSRNCYWDASEQGNGQGHDFIDIGGNVIRLSF